MSLPAPSLPVLEGQSRPTYALDAPEPRALAGAVAVAVVVAVGTLVLLLRPWLLPVGTGLGARVALFAALGVVGLAWPLRRSVGSTAGAATAAGALAVGILAFGLAWALDGRRPPVSALGLAVALNTLAAVAEEAFFRRLAFGWL
ncbi:MAG: hypothetical protein M3314_07435, partial [Actinomycetota bacterium]|nr:hypothetical protein [Actinomycetota bacterium]